MGQDLSGPVVKENEFKESFSNKKESTDKEDDVNLGAIESSSEESTDDDSSPENKIELEKSKVSKNKLKKVPNRQEYFEEETLKSPLVLSFDDVLMKFNALNTKRELNNLQKLKNYGKLPILVIHNILLFHLPIDLVNTCSTCKLFHEVFSLNHFWREYYHNYYKIKSEDKNEQNMNWKKQYFKRFTEDELAEHKISRKYSFVGTSLHHRNMGNDFDDPKVFNIAIVGSENIGKKTYLETFITKLSRVMLMME